MSQLQQILQYLDSMKVDEVVLESGRQVCFRVDGKDRVSGGRPASLNQIRSLVRNTSLQAVVESAGRSPVPRIVQLNGRVYRAQATRTAQALQLRIARGTSDADESEAPSPAQSDAQQRAQGPHQTGAPAAAGREARPPEPRGGAARMGAGSRGAGAPPAAAGARARGTGVVGPGGTREPAPEPGESGYAMEPYPTVLGDEAPAADSGTRPVSPTSDSVAGGLRPEFSGTALRAPAGPGPSPGTGPGAAVESGAKPARAAPALPAGFTDRSSDLARLLVAARRSNATDVHIVGGRQPFIRCLGRLEPKGSPIPGPRVEEMLLPLLDDAQRQTLEERGYVDLGTELPGTGRLRANIGRTATGLKGSFRLIMGELPTLEGLGLPPELQKVTSYHQGLVVIAGPNGAGKTTTLAAIVDGINGTRPHHIITVEDPVEFVHPRKRAMISQRSVGVHTRSFATALKGSLREDPDVIVIGELRDRETVEIALTAAETGHLVLATMSTPNAAKTIDRLIDLFPPDDQPQVRATLAGTLKYVVAQQLIPRDGADGGAGVVAAVELVAGSHPLWSLIRDNKLFQLPNLQQRGRAFGMLRFDDSIAQLLANGAISRETAERYARSPRELDNLLRMAQGGAAPPAGAPGGAPEPAATASPKSRLGRVFGRKGGG